MRNGPQDCSEQTFQRLRKADRAKRRSSGWAKGEASEPEMGGGGHSQGRLILSQ